MSNEQLVLGAVAQKEVSAGTGFLQKLFALWFDAFVYNQIWEDPRVDVDALKIDASSRILTISSGGCNALNYLTHRPESVTAVDLNRHHIFLLELKIAALKQLDSHGEFFDLFGAGAHPENVSRYEKRIRGELSPEARKFWESSGFPGRLFKRRRISYFEEAGLYDHSRNGYFLRFFHGLAKLLGCRPEAVLEARSLEEQQEKYERHIAPFFNSRLIKLVGKLPVTLFGLGIPPQQYEELKRDLGPDSSIIDVYEERTRKLAAGFPIKENYFAWQAFARKYDTENRHAIPAYLREENWETLKRCSGRISAHIGSITELIRNSEPGKYNRFVFLDAQDWMDRSALTDLWRAVAQKGGPESRVIFRTAGKTSPLPASLPKELHRQFEYRELESRDYFERDRASIYGGFHLYTLRKDG